MSRVFVLIGLLLVGTCRAGEPTDRRVVVISVDGLPASMLDDPRASMPVIRGLAKAGVSSPEGLRVANPSVTWPNHTTLMTGVYPDRHGVLFNGVAERRGPGSLTMVEPRKTQKELVRVPLLFDILAEAGLSSAAINWPCTRGSSSIADNFPDVPNMLRYTSPRLKESLARDGLLQRFEGSSSVIRDEVWTEAACRVIREHRPRLLVLHLLNLDSTHHQHGPQSAPGYTAIALADAMIGRVLKALDEARVRDQTAVFVLADHGFAAVTKSLRPNILLRQHGLLKVTKGRISSARAHVVSEGGIGMVYLTDPEIADQDAATVRRLFENAEGVAAVLGPDDFDRYHLPRPDRHPGMADLVLAAKDGYAISGAATGDDYVISSDNRTGSHGYLATVPKMNALFVASGAGIRTGGTTLGAVDNVDVAPTIARLLGVTMKEVAGKPLADILEGQ